MVSTRLKTNVCIDAMFDRVSYGYCGERFYACMVSPYSRSLRHIDAVVSSDGGLGVEGCHLQPREIHNSCPPQVDNHQKPSDPES